MDAPIPPAAFLGDLGDPFVASLARALPAGSLLLSCAEGLPPSWPFEAETAHTLVLHRSHLAHGDLDHLARWRREGRFERTLLCVGPHLRFRDVQTLAAAVDEVLPEATAADVLARRVQATGPTGSGRPDGPGPAVVVVSNLYDLGSMLVEVCRFGGYPTRLSPTWSEVGTERLAIWDVPVLEPGWSDALTRAARDRAVITLLGLADRALVAEARDHGASACLDLPCDPADLIFVLDRIAAAQVPQSPGRSLRVEPGHASYARPARRGNAWPAASLRPTMTASHEPPSGPSGAGDLRRLRRTERPEE